MSTERNAKIGFGALLLATLLIGLAFCASPAYGQVSTAPLVAEAKSAAHWHFVTAGEGERYADLLASELRDADLDTTTVAQLRRSMQRTADVGNIALARLDAEADSLDDELVELVTLVATLEERAESTVTAYEGEIAALEADVTLRDTEIGRLETTVTNITAIAERERETAALYASQRDAARAEVAGAEAERDEAVELAQVAVTERDEAVALLAPTLARAEAAEERLARAFEIVATQNSNLARILAQILAPQP